MSSLNIQYVSTNHLGIEWKYGSFLSYSDGYFCLVICFCTVHNMDTLHTCNENVCCDVGSPRFILEDNENI